MADISHPEHGLAIAYAPPAAKAGLAALFALDARLAEAVTRTREPTMGLIRLAWWREALTALGDGGEAREPLLAELRAAGVEGRSLAAMTEGWEVLIDEPSLTPETIETHGSARGEVLFAAAGRLLGAQAGDRDRLRAAGKLWARAEIARHWSQREEAERALESALPWAERAMAQPWPGRLRPLGMLAVLAARDARHGVDRLAPAGSPRRQWRMLYHRLTGH